MRGNALYRYWPLAIPGLFMFVGYLDRINIAVAGPTLAHDMRLDHGEMGLLFSVFLIGYAVMPVPGGYLADRIGARRMLSFATAWFAVFSGLTAVGWNFASLFVIRLLFGVGEGAGLPASLKATHTWSAAHRRGLGSAIYLTGVNIGGILAPLLTVAILSRLGWRPVFSIMALPGLLVALLAWRYLKDRPDEVLSESEIARAKMEVPAGTAVNRALMYRTWSIWAMFTAFFFYNITYWGLLLWVPSYLAEVRHVTLSELGLWSSIPWMGGLLGSYVLGWLSDRMPGRRHVQAASWVLSGVCVALTYSANSGPAAVAFLTVVYFAMLGGVTSQYALMMDLVGVEAAGVAMGSMYFFGVLAGFLAPVLIGFVIQQTHAYAVPFGILAGSIIVAGLVVTTVRERRINLSVVLAEAAVLREGGDARIGYPTATP